MNWKKHATPAELERLNAITETEAQCKAARKERVMIYDRCRRRAERTKNDH